MQTMKFESSEFPFQNVYDDGDILSVTKQHTTPPIPLEPSPPYSGSTFTIFLKPLISGYKSVQVDPNMKVLELQRLASEIFMDSCVGLIFAGKKLRLFSTLSEYNISFECHIHTLLRRHIPQRVTHFLLEGESTPRVIMHDLRSLDRVPQRRWGLAEHLGCSPLQLSYPEPKIKVNYDIPPEERPVTCRHLPFAIDSTEVEEEVAPWPQYHPVLPGLVWRVKARGMELAGRRAKDMPTTCAWLDLYVAFLRAPWFVRALCVLQGDEFPERPSSVVVPMDVLRSVLEWTVVQSGPQEGPDGWDETYPVLGILVRQGVPFFLLYPWVYS